MCHHIIPPAFIPSGGLFIPQRAINPQVKVLPFSPINLPYFVLRHVHKEVCL